MPSHSQPSSFLDNNAGQPGLIIPQAGEGLAHMMATDQKVPMPKQTQLATASFKDGCIVIYADGHPVLKLSVQIALDLMARIAVACKDAIKGRP
jgi:hypothetical protein